VKAPVIVHNASFEQAAGLLERGNSGQCKPKWIQQLSSIPFRGQPVYMRIFLSSHTDFVRRHGELPNGNCGQEGTTRGLAHVAFRFVQKGAFMAEHSPFVALSCSSVYFGKFAILALFSSIHLPWNLARLVSSSLIFIRIDGAMFRSIFMDMAGALGSLYRFHLVNTRCISAISVECAH
jgi:hypothetical protein